MAAKIKLKRLGKVRNPQYRIVVADARTRRDGRAIEELGIYHPKEEPSLIRLDSERVQYWLGVGAQPTDAVAAILRVTGDWQKYKGLEGAEGTLKTKDAKRDKTERFNELLVDEHGASAKVAPAAKPDTAAERVTAKPAEPDATDQTAAGAATEPGAADESDATA